ncbi:biotin/lipoyl-binding protein [Nostoc sp. FACHB-888]|uniref:ABC transporter permease n=1 Tax=Nostoc sp. FACHB-888 TaxID=2692842 RepID=UPI001F54C918|nr:biotin/lipoyl-binding protein [Nostoc sp. FACHB-888]
MYNLFLHDALQPQPRADILKVSGRIEGYETEIGVKLSGRIESIAVREGAAVKKGEKLIKLDNSNDQLLQGQLQSANAQIASAQSDEQQARSDVERVQGEIEEVNSQILEAQLNLQQSRGDTVGQVNQARANTAVARAQVVQAQAVLKQAAAEVKLAKINRDRYAKLLNDGAVTQQQFDQTQTTFDTAIATLQAREAAVNAASEQLIAAQAALTQAQSTGFNPGIRNAQLEVFLTDSVLFGLLFGVRSSNQNAAVQSVSVIGFVTSLLLSGFIYPISNIPFPISLMPNIVPARYFIDITRDAFVRGTGWAGVWFDVVVLIVFGLVFFNITRRALGRMQLPY